MNQECLIILSPDLSPLGELNLDGETCSQINLNQEGEELLGPHIAQWQTHGLDRPTLNSIRTDEGLGHAVCHDQVKLNSEDFASALRVWLDDHGYLHLTLPLGAMAAFCEIQKMEIDQQKKFELAVMLRDLPIHKLV